MDAIHPNDDSILQNERASLQNEMDLVRHVILLYGEVRLDPTILEGQQDRDRIRHAWSEVNAAWQVRTELLTPEVRSCIKELMDLV